MSRFDDELFDDEYSAISLRFDGGLASLALFLLQWVTPYLVRQQPWRPERIWLWPLVTPTALFILSFLGLLCGLYGRRRSKRASAPRFGVLLNGAVFGILLLWGALILLIVASGRSTVFKPQPKVTRPRGVELSAPADPVRQRLRSWSPPSHHRSPHRSSGFQ